MAGPDTRRLHPPGGKKAFKIPPGNVFKSGSGMAGPGLCRCISVGCVSGKVRGGERKGEKSFSSPLCNRRKTVRAVHHEIRGRTVTHIAGRLRFSSLAPDIDILCGCLEKYRIKNEIS